MQIAKSKRSSKLPGYCEMKHYMLAAIQRVAMLGLTRSRQGQVRYSPLLTWRSTRLCRFFWFELTGFGLKLKVFCYVDDVLCSLLLLTADVWRNCHVSSKSYPWKNSLYLALLYTLSSPIFARFSFMHLNQAPPTQSTVFGFCFKGYQVGLLQWIKCLAFMRKLW